MAFSRDFLDRLAAVVVARQGKQERDEIKFLCPAHDDHNASAGWNITKHVWHCFVCGGGGGAFDLARRLGIERPIDLPSGLTLQELADYVGVPSDFLRSVGLSEDAAGVERAKCVDIAYLNDAGELRAVRKRLRLNGEPRMIWRRGDHVMPYGLSRLDNACAAGSVILVEGESDSWICWFTGVPALGLPGASTWKEEYKRYLQDITTVYIWRELDKGGDSLMEAVTKDLPNARIIEPPSGLKDLNELWHAVGHDKEQFLSRLGSLRAAARPASQLRVEALSTEARDLLGRCRSLLEDPRLLDRVKASITANGYAGDPTAPTLSYLAITSRLLERPLNLAFVAPSGAGKNAAVDASLVLMPEEAYFLEKAGSARALIYSEASFEHT